MQNRAWIREYTQSMGVIAFQEYECRVWKTLEQLKDNSFYDIRKIGGIKTPHYFILSVIINFEQVIGFFFCGAHAWIFVQ